MDKPKLMDSSILPHHGRIVQGGVCPVPLVFGLVRLSWLLPYGRCDSSHWFSRKSKNKQRGWFQSRRHSDVPPFLRPQSFERFAWHPKFPWANFGLVPVCLEIPCSIGPRAVQRGDAQTGQGWRNTHHETNGNAPLDHAQDHFGPGTGNGLFDNGGISDPNREMNSPDGVASKKPISWCKSWAYNVFRNLATIRSPAIPMSAVLIDPAKTPLQCKIKTVAMRP